MGRLAVQPFPTRRMNIFAGVQGQRLAQREVGKIRFRDNRRSSPVIVKPIKSHAQSDRGARRFRAPPAAPAADASG